MYSFFNFSVDQMLIFEVNICWLLTECQALPAVKGAYGLVRDKAFQNVKEQVMLRLCGTFLGEVLWFF